MSTTFANLDELAIYLRQELQAKKYLYIRQFNL